MNPGITDKKSKMKYPLYKIKRTQNIPQVFYGSLAERFLVTSYFEEGEKDIDAENDIICQLDVLHVRIKFIKH